MNTKSKFQPVYLVYVLVFLPFLLGTLNEVLGVPRAVRYLLDVIWCLLLALMGWKARKTGFGATKMLAAWIAVFFCYTLISYAFHFQSPLYYLWGVRNNFRFYVAFFAFAVFLIPNAVEKILKLFDILFWVNFVVSLVQYFRFDILQDLLGGIFGTEMGVNGYTNLFFIIVIAKSMLFYWNGRESAWLCAAKCAAALTVSAFAELKFFNVAFLLVAGMAVLFTGIDWKHLFTSRNNWKKLLFLVLCCVGFYVSSVMVEILFPSFENWYQVTEMVEIVTTDTGYTGIGDLNRLTALSQINEYWLTGWGQRLFGLGLGNTDTASFAFLNTPFYQEYGDSHYSWFSYAIMYLECGWIGLLFYFGFFGLVFFAAMMAEKKCQGNARMYCMLTKIAALLCCLISVYNNSLRVESGYMMYLVLALPFVFGPKKELLD